MKDIGLPFLHLKWNKAMTTGVAASINLDRLPPIKGPTLRCETNQHVRRAVHYISRDYYAKKRKARKKFISINNHSVDEDMIRGVTFAWQLQTIYQYGSTGEEEGVKRRVCLVEADVNEGSLSVTERRQSVEARRQSFHGRKESFRLHWSCPKGLTVS